MVEHVLDHRQQPTGRRVRVAGRELVERHPAHQVGGAVLLHHSRLDRRVDVDRVQQVDAVEVLVLITPAGCDGVDVVHVDETPRQRPQPGLLVELALDRVVR